MNTLKLILLGAALSALSAPAHATVLLNAGFETGDLAGWIYTDGFAEVVTGADDAIVTPPFGEHFTATEGGHFARLTAGPETGIYATIQQSFALTAASQLSFDAAFLAFDYLDYNDDAYVIIRGLSGEEPVFVSSVAAVGDQGHTPWGHFTSGPLAIGAYVLEAGVRNVGDPDAFYSSQLLLDNVSLSAITVTGVPEPATWAMMIIGFGAAGSIVRTSRRRRLQTRSGV